MSYRYPAPGIPGAPPRSRRPPNTDQTAEAEPAERRLQDTKRRLYAEERHAFAVLSLRVWLASLPVGGWPVRRQYVAWQVGTDWATAGTFDKGLGGFSALKREAVGANAEVRRAGGDPFADALVQAACIRPKRSASADGDGQSAPYKVADPVPIPFPDALRAVLAGPTSDAQPPKQ
ncbi:MAG: hypothetical protein ABSG43_27360 [Solirubrobacteraceae bacterium]